MAARADTLPDSCKLTYADYVTLPDDGRRYEILDGELAVSPSPTSRHQLVSHNLDVALSNWVRARGLGRMWAAPLDLILALRPDILAKGADYREEAVVGAPEVKSWGGQVVLIPLVEDRSTTGIIQRMA